MAIAGAIANASLTTGDIVTGYNTGHAVSTGGTSNGATSPSPSAT